MRLILAVSWALALAAARAAAESEVPCSEPERVIPEPDVANLSTVHVAYTSDSRNFPGLLSSMLSLSRNLVDPRNCHIHVIVPKDDMQKASMLRDCFTTELAEAVAPAVTLHEMLPLPFNISNFLEYDRPDLLKPIAYARLLLHEYLPAVPRVLYMDTDTIVRSDVAVLYRMRMHYGLAAAADMAGKITLLTCCEQNPLLCEMVLGMKGDGLNSGVLLMNLDRWRMGIIPSSVRDWLEASRGCKAEQAALSLAFQQRFDRLPWQWHAQGLGGQRSSVRGKCLSRASLLHWSNSKKPWHHARNEAYDPFVRPYVPRYCCLALPSDLPALYAGTSEGQCASA